MSFKSRKFKKLCNIFKIVLGPSFKGQIHVMQSLEVPELPPIAVPEPIVHKVPDGLFPRFQPFGSGILNV